jgi:hypothetical protein
MMPPLSDFSPYSLCHQISQQQGMREAMPPRSEHDSSIQALPLTAETSFVVVKSPKKMKSLCTTGNSSFNRQRTA